ncbi:MAG TPA: iron-sulfur cluster assembly scaffold protein [Syntrophobacteraceae bacterium]|jgi:nitrogen fixation protein NifU and related proteins|nr:iron-sulfur cluster assembly scaffold protein [Syntrophobacteraceae bacterium]HBZ56651.1 iron-sulfur cluster assembly scaffold protein [Syntrophobacteraceae bacterium]
MYSEKVMDHFSNPRNAGVIDDADGIGEVGNPVCGDMMTFYIKVEEGRLVNVKFNTFGCVAAIAVSSMVSEMAEGKLLDEAKKISNQVVAEALGGLPKSKMHCSNLGAEALALAIEDYEERRAGRPRSAGHEGEAGKRRNVCTRCDMVNPDDAKFCMDCGEKLACEVLTGLAEAV